MNTNGLSSTIAFLTAMITPVLLISACGSLVLSTSTRLGRVIDRVRELELRLAEMIDNEEKSAITMYYQRLGTVFDLIDKVTSRARLLQRAMVVFYYGLGCFALTSVSIGAVGLLDFYRWMPIAIGMIGIGYLTYGSFLLILEAKLARDTVNTEMDFTWQLARKVAPKEIVDKYPESGIFGKSIMSIFVEVMSRSAKRRTKGILDK